MDLTPNDGWILHDFVPHETWGNFCKAWSEDEQDYCGWRDDEHLDYHEKDKA